VRSIERTLERCSCRRSARSARAARARLRLGRLATGLDGGDPALAQPASRPDGVLVLTRRRRCTRRRCTLQALELILRRGGLRTLLLSATADAAHLAPAGRGAAGRGPSSSRAARGVARRAGAHRPTPRDGWSGDRGRRLRIRGAIPHDGLSIVHPTTPPELAAAREGCPRSGSSAGRRRLALRARRREVSGAARSGAVQKRPT